MSKHTLFIEGMACAHCLNAVNRAIAGVPGVRLVSVAVGRALVECDPEQLVAVTVALDHAGYRAQVAPPA